MNAAGPGAPTLGVEEEFLLVDPATDRPVPSYTEVAGALDRATTAADVMPELLTSQIEAASPPFRTLAALRADVTRTREALAAAAARAGVRLLATGYAPVAAERTAVSDGARYHAIADRYHGLLNDYHACGCHVHVAVPDRETAVAVVNHLRPWLPTLLALSANSPYADGRDTGCASWRAVAQSRFPGFGLPPWCGDAAAYDRAMERLEACGVTVDARMTFWLARPSEHVPTVEVRVADVAMSVDETVLHAGLVRALVRRARADVEAGLDAPRLDDAVAEAAVWAAARYGLDGLGVHPAEEREVPVRRLLTDLFAHVRGALEETGDLAEVRGLLRTVLARGNGARRQRAAGRAGGLRAVIDAVTVRPGPDGEPGRPPVEAFRTEAT